MATFNDNDGLDFQTSIHGWSKQVAAGDNYTITRKDRLVRLDCSGTGGVISFGLGYDGQAVTLLVADDGGSGYVTAPVSGSYTISPQAVTDAGHWVRYVYDAAEATWFIVGISNT